MRLWALRFSNSKKKSKIKFFGRSQCPSRGSPDVGHSVGTKGANQHTPPHRGYLPGARVTCSGLKVHSSKGGYTVCTLRGADATTMFTQVVQSDYCYCVMVGWSDLTHFMRTVPAGACAERVLRSVEVAASLPGLRFPLPPSERASLRGGRG